MYARNEKIIPVSIEDEMKDSYISYAMSVIVGRALPDARDGLKPVHRRILYTMAELGLEHTKPYKKSARIVGNCLGQYHPHGDVAVYDALVRMVQDFSLRYPLIDGQGNFGCFTGDTKIRLVDGTVQSFRELSRLPAGEPFYVYSVDRENRIVIGKGRDARITRRRAQLVEVLLDNGAKIRCTPDHPFLLRDGTYKQANELTAADSLMAGYFDTAPVREDELFEVASRRNHRIRSVQYLSECEDVYDITVEEYHNFLLEAGVFVHNSVDGDAAAAMRYTEARLAAITDLMLADLDKETVDFAPNFDETLKEPSIMPAALPNLLVNGSSGIAVGMATNIPPHNLSEIIDGVSILIDNPDASMKELMRAVKGPDFPTGGVICGREGIRNAYQTGRGRLRVRAKANIETQEKSGRERIVVTEIPYQVNKSTLIEETAGLVNEKRLEGISDIRDESDKDGMRIVFELKRDAQASIVMNNLYRHTQMEATFGVIMLALVERQPRVLNLKQMLEEYIAHRKEIVIRRTKYELDRAEKRAHILEGLKIAVANLDAVIKTIRQSKTPPEAKEALIAKFKLSAEQAQAILEMQLQRLTQLERKKLDEEYLDLIKKIEIYKSILASEKKVLAIIKEEAEGIKKRFGDARRTEIVAEAEDLEIEDLIAEEDVVIPISHSGYIKRMPVSAYRKQRRGGKGVTGAETKEEDFIEHLFVASTHDYILIFTSKGNLHWLKVHEIPEAGRLARGKPIVNLLQLASDETISALVPVKEFSPDKFLFMATKFGTVKKTRLDAFSNPRRGGIIAISLDKGDELIEAEVTDGQREVLLATREGKAIRFSESKVRDTGRQASGVRGMRLAKKDGVIGMEIVRKDATILTVTEGGFGKRSEIDKYRITSRGGQGVTNIKGVDKVGRAIRIKTVTDEDDLMVITQNGMVVRLPVKDIRTTGRSTQGVRIIRLGDKDKVVAVARLAAKEEEEASQRRVESPSSSLV